MADPVRVQRERRDLGDVTETVGHVHPDDLARAIRREMAAEIGTIRDDLRKGVEIDDALRWSHDRLTAAAPREPAQDEPAAGPDPDSVTADKALAWDMMDRANLRGRAAGFAEGVEAAAQLAEQAGCGKPGCRDCVGGALSHSIRALTPPAAPDPLLPGLRAARDVVHACEAGWAERHSIAGGKERQEAAAYILRRLAAEIARRGGA